MISSVRGEVIAIGLDHAVVEVGGVGLAVQATPNTLATLRRGQQARLATALVVREDSLTLFGFTDDEQRDVFGLLQSVAGIGPRMALATLAVLDPDALATALLQGDVKALTRVPGIGPKVAQRMVLELKDKVVAPAAAPALVPQRLGGDPRREQVVEALLGLGFTARPAEAAVDNALAADAPPTPMRARCCGPPSPRWAAPDDRCPPRRLGRAPGRPPVHPVDRACAPGRPGMPCRPGRRRCSGASCPAFAVPPGRAVPRCDVAGVRRTPLRGRRG